MTPVLAVVICVVLLACGREAAPDPAERPRQLVSATADSLVHPDIPLCEAPPELVPIGRRRPVPQLVSLDPRRQ